VELLNAIGSSNENLKFKEASLMEANDKVEKLRV
jgi:hypothetical protein